ncbi:histidinol-phosphate aminotransferase [Terracoccus luteus]|uniref:Aminotransferase n=1 Tax=Terracoccus luteus TaxID=53356 RepID=A0A495Y4S8_9MICO|nr:Rv2231c family pyridoxal phosphate-dependent protein CobC [Terracoccus luteus]RKT79898.1 histidinol-phosphate aminotransferase [Terracoccus luteus]
MRHPHDAYDAGDEHDLHHHGDRDLGDGLVDLAVNVRLTTPPAWLRDVLVDSLSGLGAYPDDTAAVAAIAARHGVDPACVLPTAGGAEAFTLVARGLGVRRPVVVHPQFTEPEAALRAAGHRPLRHVLVQDDGFAFTTGTFERNHRDSDLVVVGNPTNPTGVLHEAGALRSLTRPGRTLVVDEAFMDAVPGEPETLLTPGASLQGLLVVRSLTKTWGLAGLRAGYVVGDPELVASLRAVQPPWAVSGPALAATVACLSDEAVAEADRGARQLDARRAVLVTELARLGIRPAAPSVAPFVLLDTSAAGAHSRRKALANLGFAVRRGETFPGLLPAHLRVAVRDENTSRRFVSALHSTLGSHRAA